MRRSSMISSAARSLLVASLALLVLSCASAPKLRPGPPSTAEESCEDVDYRGVYRDEGHPEGRRFRLKARVCRSGRVFAEIRGPVGGPGLVVAARPGEARLLFPRERVAVDGPDAPAFWMQWTGAPLSGALLVDLMAGRFPDSSPLEGWRFESRGGETFPAELRARGPGALSFELSLRDQRPAAEPPAWPAVPESFEHRVETDR